MNNLKRIDNFIRSNLYNEEKIINNHMREIDNINIDHVTLDDAFKNNLYVINYEKLFFVINKHILHEKLQHIFLLYSYSHMALIPHFLIYDYKTSKFLRYTDEFIFIMLYLHKSDLSKYGIDAYNETQLGVKFKTNIRESNFIEFIKKGGDIFDSYTNYQDSKSNLCIEGYINNNRFEFYSKFKSMKKEYPHTSNNNLIMKSFILDAVEFCADVYDNLSLDTKFDLDIYINRINTINMLID